MKSNLNKIRNLFIVLVIPFLFNSSAFAFVSQGKDLPKYVVSEDDRFNKIFREGRDLIDREEWAKAAAKFNEIVCDCPEKQYVDAAFYWLAFCYKKQKMFGEMNAALDRLLKFFPNSSWADDARVMKYESNQAIFMTSAATPRGSLSRLPSAIAGNAEATALLTTLNQTPLDREDEIKLAAFQSLFSANPKRAIEILGDILKTDSKASETLKREIIRSLRTRQFSAADNYFSFAVGSESNSKLDIQFLPPLREALAKGYRSESSVKIRAEIIYALSGLNDDESYAYITSLYASEENKELKKAIINSFGGSQFYTFATASSIGRQRKQNFDKLLEILRTEKDTELRRLALSNLQKFSDWSASAGIIETLSQIYDSETDEALKLSIIRSLAVSKQNGAAAKLLDIAKTDKNDKMRLEAVRSLRSSKDPQVVKFLEDLIK